jgi:hypothetical protein
VTEEAHKKHVKTAGIWWTFNQDIQNTREKRETLARDRRHFTLHVARWKQETQARTVGKVELNTSTCIISQSSQTLGKHYKSDCHVISISAKHILSFFNFIFHRFIRPWKLVNLRHRTNQAASSSVNDVQHHNIIKSSYIPFLLYFQHSSAGWKF